MIVLAMVWLQQQLLLVSLKIHRFTIAALFSHCTYNLPAFLQISYTEDFPCLGRDACQSGAQGSWSSHGKMWWWGDQCEAHPANDRVTPCDSKCSLEGCKAKQSIIQGLKKCIIIRQSFWNNTWKPQTWRIPTSKMSKPQLKRKYIIRYETTGKILGLKIKYFIASHI